VLFESLIEFLESAARLQRLVVWIVQVGIFVLSGVAAFLLRFDGAVPAAHLVHLAWAVPVWVAVKVLVFGVCGLDRDWWRFVSVDDVIRIGFGNTVGSVFSFVALRWLAPPGFPRSVYLLDMVICFLGTSGVRVAIRMIRESCEHRARPEPAQRTLIYGAGRAGVALLREIRANRRLPYKVCGFVDDDPEKAGLVIHGAKVLGSGQSLAQSCRRHMVEIILIAVPSARGPQMTRILRMCQKAGVAYKTVPGLGEIIESNGLAKHVREVAVEDLLGRSPVRLDENQIQAKLRGRVVLVTGAAGSIGSELCRQIARYQPAALIGFEIAESGLFELEREIRYAFPTLNFRPEIGSIQNPPRLGEVFRQYSPSAVYHAAAYKHVPLMETHAFEAIENNVFGTYNVALAAAKHAVEDFVLVSSDKAVRPASVMGATKRLAELVVLSFQGGRPKFVAVRFGNVLGSSGSVVPIFKRQIAEGRPVTVTHPEMRRFFMTIPEAVQLILQASSMGRGGEIFVLEMGEPVKIVDLARNLILLSGFRLDEDIKIEFTGIRPGEKLFEELSTQEESTLPTSHEKIRVFRGDHISRGALETHLDILRRLCQTGDTRGLVLELKEIVPEYNPSSHLLKQVLGRETPAKAMGVGA